MQKMLFWIISLVIIAAVIFSALWFTFHKPDDPNVLPISGNIEITQVQVSFRVAGRMDQRWVKEGQYVEKNQKVATLDTRDLTQEVKAHQAEVAIAQAALLELQNGNLPEEIASAQAKVDQTTADLNYQNANYKRQQELFERQVISAREFESNSSVYEIAKARQKEAEENLRFIQNGTRIEQMKQAEARLSHAQEILGLAEMRVSYGELLAPLSGYVLTANVQPGEMVSIGTPVVTMGDLNDIWLRSYINESDLGRVKLSQEVDVVTDSYPDKIYHGIISYIASEAEFTPKNVQTQKERVKLVYMIKVSLDNSLQELKPGMPADGRILFNNPKHS